MKYLKKKQYYVITAIILLGIAIYQMAHITGPVMLPDEFGYWANAAQLLGYDWSDVVSLQSYYSYGYSFLLFPFLKFIDSPTIIYKSAVLLNILFVYLHAVYLWKIADSLHSNQRRFNVFFCSMAAFYPSVLFNMQMTWTESLISLLFILSIWLFIEYERTGKAEYSIGIVVCLNYLYFVHMRTLGILVSGIVTLLFMMLRIQRESGKKIIRIFLILAGSLIAGILLKEWLQSGLYIETESELLNTNDYAGQMDKIKVLMTYKGIYYFLISCIGKLFYLGLATCGTVYFGIWHMLKELKEKVLFVYILSAFSLTFFITALYTMYGGRADTYIYGRYNEFMIPLFIYFGLYEMLNKKHIGKIAAGIAAVHGVMAYVMLREMTFTNPDGFQGYFTVGISYALREYMPRIQDYILLPYAAGTIVMLLLALVMGLFIRKKKIMITYLILFIGLYIYTAVSAGNKYLYDHSIDTGADMAMTEQIREQLEAGDTVLFVHSESDIQYLDTIQFSLKEHTLQVVKEDELRMNADKMPKFIVTYKNSKMKNLLRQQYDTVMETYHFKVYCTKKKSL